MWARKLIAERTWSIVFVSGFALWVVLRTGLLVIRDIPRYGSSAAAWRTLDSSSPGIIFFAACMIVAVMIALALDTRPVRNIKQAASIGFLLGFIGIIASVGIALRTQTFEYAVVRGAFILAAMATLSIVLYAFRGGELPTSRLVE